MTSAMPSFPKYGADLSSLTLVMCKKYFCEALVASCSAEPRSASCVQVFRVSMPQLRAWRWSSIVNCFKALEQLARPLRRYWDNVAFRQDLSNKQQQRLRRSEELPLNPADHDGGDAVSVGASHKSAGHAAGLAYQRMLLVLVIAWDCFFSIGAVVARATHVPFPTERRFPTSLGSRVAHSWVKEHLS